MVNDWSSKANPDLLHFVPYTWKLGVMLKEFELITLSNEYNWVDCSSTNQENGTCATNWNYIIDTPVYTHMKNSTKGIPKFDLFLVSIWPEPLSIQ